MAIRIDVSVEGEEAILKLGSLPKRLRKALVDKMYGAMSTAKDQMLEGVPGKYLDKDYIDAFVEQQGDVLIGTLRAEDKPGFYKIPPGDKRTFMRFIAKSGDLVRTTKVWEHPYPKGGPAIERYFLEHKPWLIEQIEDAVFDVVYN